MYINILLSSSLIIIIIVVFICNSTFKMIMTETTSIIYLSFHRFKVFHLPLSLCWGAGGVLCFRRSTVEEASRVTVSYVSCCWVLHSEIRYEGTRISQGSPIYLISCWWTVSASLSARLKQPVVTTWLIEKSVTEFWVLNKLHFGKNALQECVEGSIFLLIWKWLESWYGSRCHFLHWRQRFSTSLVALFLISRRAHVVHMQDPPER